MSLAESTILLSFHAVRMGLLILRHVVVTLFANRTCQCNLCAHDFHLHLNFRCFSVSFCHALLLAGSRQNLSIKKRPKLFHSPHYYITRKVIRQYLFYQAFSGVGFGFFVWISRLYFLFGFFIYILCVHFSFAFLFAFSFLFFLSRDCKTELNKNRPEIRSSKTVERLRSADLMALICKNSRKCTADSRAGD